MIEKRYSAPRGWAMKCSTPCLSCMKTIEHNVRVPRKYCDNVCQQAHAWTLMKQSIENGGKGNYRRYIIEKYGEQCSLCSQPPMWNGKPLQLQLDHIDGNSGNNIITNLRLLCPHCHTQTETWGFRNAGKGRKSIKTMP